MTTAPIASPAPSIAPPRTSSGVAAKPSPAITPPPGNPRFPLFDAIRALCLLAVMLVHVISPWQQYHWWGAMAQNVVFPVFVFFGISGFLLYRPFVNRHAAGRPAPSVRSYARRRLLRILPGYWVALTVLGLTLGLSGVFSNHWWIYYGLLQSYQENSGHGIEPAWTLSVEMSFYALMPVIALVVRRGDPAGWMRRELIAIAAFGLVPVALRLGAFAGEYPKVYTALPFVSTAFAVGMALAVASVAHERSRRIASCAPLLWLLAASCFALASYVYPQPSDPRTHVTHVELELHYLLMASAVACVLLPAVYEGSTAVHRLLRVRPLALLGLISYGVYIYHGPVLEHLAPALGRRPQLLPFGPIISVSLALLAISVLLAAVSYHWVELPFLRRKERGGIA